MDEIFSCHELAALVKQHWAPLLVGAVLMPLAMNLGAGLIRRIRNRLRTYPTIAVGAVYQDCITPGGGYYPELTCIKNGWLSVVMQTRFGGQFFVYNRDLRDWVLPIIYDPHNPPSEIPPSTPFLKGGIEFVQNQPE